MSKFEKLHNIGTSLVVANQTLVLENSETRNGKIDKWFELGGLEGSSKQNIELLPHKPALSTVDEQTFESNELSL